VLKAKQLLGAVHYEIQATKKILAEAGDAAKVSIQQPKTCLDIHAAPLISTNQKHAINNTYAGRDRDESRGEGGDPQGQGEPAGTQPEKLPHQPEPLLHVRRRGGHQRQEGEEGNANAARQVTKSIDRQLNNQSTDKPHKTTYSNRSRN